MSVKSNLKRAQDAIGRARNALTGLDDAARESVACRKALRELETAERELKRATKNARQAPPA